MSDFEAEKRAAEELMDKFPLQFPRDPETGARCGLCCSSGWFGLIEDICETIQVYCDQTFFMVTEKSGEPMSIHPPQVTWNWIKERFGVGHFSYELEPWPISVIGKCDDKTIQELTSRILDTLEGMELFAEHRSRKTCERCGEPVERKGYLAVRCPDCAEEEGFVARSEEPPPPRYYFKPMGNRLNLKLVGRDGVSLANWKSSRQ
jgi:hypothetical protein